MKNEGLTDNQVEVLRGKHGLNVLSEEKPFSALIILFDQFKSPLIYLLFGAIIFSLLFNESLDALLIVAVIILNVVMGFFQEYHAQRTLEALKKIVKPQATVLRNGERKVVVTSELVPGDIVFLGSGDSVPADGRLIEGNRLLVNEAILTGESEAVEKSKKEKQNLLFMGTTVVAGRCTMEVERTGTGTEIGKIGKSIETIKDVQTPLQKKLNDFSRTLLFVIVAVSVVIYFVGSFYNLEWTELLRYAVILSVAAIPEGLPIAVTVILSLGMRRILRKKGLVKRLISIETLGAASVICTDKTGTLTEGVMKVVETDFKEEKFALRGLLALNTQRTSLEVAVWEYLKSFYGKRLEEAKEEIEIIDEVPFESENKYAMASARFESKIYTFAVGAPEIVVKFCSSGKKVNDKILDRFDYWTKKGLRVVGLCYKKGEGKSNTGFIWLGLIGIQDPVRPTVEQSIARARNAGIDIKIVTGDYFQTALSVANQIGLNITKENVMEGAELEKISPESLRKQIKNLVLFSRVSPHQKLKIVEALQANGEVVAMTGDGVNDAPALKKANIGIAVGSATDVAKESSDLILLDNNFRTIVASIEEGRIIYSNIKKVVAYVLSNSFAEIVLIMGAIVIGAPLPLTIAQILFIHLVCDGPPDIVLGFEPGEEGIMEEKPRKLHDEKILELPMLVLIILISLTAGIAALWAFEFFLNGGNEMLARTIALGVIGSIDLTYIFSYKNLRVPLFRMKNFFDNKFLIASVIYGFTLVFLGIYHPFFNQVLGTTPLSLKHWFPIITASVVTIFWVELVKYLTQARNKAK